MRTGVNILQEFLNSRFLYANTRGPLTPTPARIDIAEIYQNGQSFLHAQISKLCNFLPNRTVFVKVIKKAAKILFSFGTVT